MRWCLLLLLWTACAPAAAAVADERGRDKARQPERVVAFMELEAGMAVADVGAGDGYFTHRLAHAVGPSGHVVATDIDLFQLARLVLRPAHAHAAPIEARLSEARQPGLETGRYDRVLLAQVDQYLADRPSFFAGLARALAREGRLIVQNRQVYRAAVIDAAGRAGLRLLAAEDLAIANQFVLSFVRSEGEATP